MVEPKYLMPAFTWYQANALMLLNSASAFTPETYGAVGNGIDDDTIAVEAAIEAAADYGNGLVWLSKTYLVGECDLQSNITIDGGGTLKRKSGSTTYALACTTSEVYQNITIRNIRINGNKANTSSGGGIVAAGTNIVIENCYIYDCPNAAINIGFRTGGYGLRITNNRFLNCGKSNGWGAVGVTGGLDAVITGNQIVCNDAQGVYGIDIEPNAMDYAGIGRILIANNQIRGGHIYVDGGNLTGGLLQDVSVTGNLVDATGSYLTTFANDAPFTCRSTKNLKVSDNTFIDNPLSAIAMRAMVLVSGNVNFDISNNYCVMTGIAGSDQGIRGLGVNSYGSISNNTLIGLGANPVGVGIYGFSAADGLDHVRAVNNTTLGGVTELYQIGDLDSYYQDMKVTTANRPTAMLQIGDMVLDTTLDADGYPIWWQGTKFIKSDGTNA